MRRFSLRATAFLACLLGGGVAQAVPVIYDFAGNGSVCTFATSGSCASVYQGALTGTVTIDVLASGPSGFDSAIVGTSYAYDYNGWVQSDFLIEWGSNSFNPAVVPWQTSANYFTQIDNDRGVDRVLNYEQYQGYDGSTSYVAYALLERSSYDLSWLSGLSFPLAGLAPSGTNYILFAGYTWNRIGGYSGLIGSISLTSLTARATSVPEPGTLALFGLGLAGLGFAKRRRVAAVGSTSDRD